MARYNGFDVGEHIEGRLISEVNEFSLDTIEDVDGKGIYRFEYTILRKGAAQFNGKRPIPVKDPKYKKYAAALRNDKK